MYLVRDKPTAYGRATLRGSAVPASRLKKNTFFLLTYSEGKHAIYDQSYL